MKYFVTTVFFFLSSCSVPVEALNSPNFIESNRSFILSECPRTLSLSRVDPKQSGAKASPENIWGPKEDARQETAIGWFAAFAPPLIDGALDVLGNWLSTRAEVQQTRRVWIASGFAADPPAIKLSAETGVESKLGSSQCIVLIAGNFSPDVGAGVKPKDDQSIKTGDWVSPWLDAFDLIDPPSFYAEIEMEYSASELYYRMRPRFVELRKGSLKIGDETPRHWSFALVLSFNGSAAGVASFDLPKVPPGTLLHNGHLSDVISPWMVTVPKPNEAPEDWLAKTPLSVQSTLVESAEPSGLNLVMAKIFTLIRPSVANKSKELVESISISNDVVDIPD